MRTILGDHAEEFEIVAEVATAQQAVDCLAETSPDVVLLDARMPMTDGYELAGQLLEVRPDIHLILLSAVVDGEVREQARRAGIHACLDKGAFDDVPRAIRELLSSEPGATAAPG
jgi:DNA-binding NarL/FixJ family response regulator